MRTLKLPLLLCTLLASSYALQAQKLLIFNSAALLEDMPEVKEAQANLETLQQQLQAKGQKMVKDYQTKYDDLQRQQKDGSIAPKDLDTEAQKLKDMEDSIHSTGRYADSCRKTPGADMFSSPVRSCQSGN